MSESEISSKIRIRKEKSNDEVSMEQEYTKIRAGSDRIMALHYKAPLYLTVELEKFFEKFNPIEKLGLNIGDTGWIGVNYRGLIDGKDKNLDEYYDYKILIVEEFKCPKRSDIQAMGKSSEFKPNFTIENH